MAHTLGAYPPSYFEQNVGIFLYMYVYIYIYLFTAHTLGAYPIHHKSVNAEIKSGQNRSSLIVARPESRWPESQRPFFITGAYPGAYLAHNRGDALCQWAQHFIHFSRNP